MQTYHPRTGTETLILYTILDCVQFLNITTFGLIPFLGFEHSLWLFSVLNNPDIGFQHLAGTFCMDKLQTWESGSSGYTNLHLTPTLYPAFLLIYKDTPKRVLETLHLSKAPVQADHRKNNIERHNLLNFFLRKVWRSRNGLKLYPARHTIITTGLSGISTN